MNREGFIGKHVRFDKSVIYACYLGEQTAIGEQDDNNWRSIRINMDEVDAVIAWLEAAKKRHAAYLDEMAEADMLGHILSDNPN